MTIVSRVMVFDFFIKLARKDPELGGLYPSVSQRSQHLGLDMIFTYPKGKALGTHERNKPSAWRRGLDNEKGTSLPIRH